MVTPEILATVSEQGVNGVSWAFHRAIRARMKWPDGAMKPRPVHLNTWEGFYFTHDLEALKELADAAARVGIERYVLDDGWFRGAMMTHRPWVTGWWMRANIPMG
jgi:alpha-galactosidase